MSPPSSVRSFSGNDTSSSDECFEATARLTAFMGLNTIAPSMRRVGLWRTVPQGAVKGLEPERGVCLNGYVRQ